MRNNGQIFSRGFDGSTELGLAGGTTPAVIDTIFVARTAIGTFERGFYAGDDRNINTTRTMANAAIGDAIGFNADVRGEGTIGSLDNLSIIPEPATYPLIFGFAAIGLIARRRRRTA